MFRAILNGLDDKINLPSLLRKISVTDELFSNPDYRIDKNQIQSFWNNVDTKVQSSYLGLELGSRINIHELGIIGMFYLYSTSIRVAIEKQVTYSKVLSSFVEIKIEKATVAGNERIVIEFERSHPKPNYAIQCQTMIIINTVLELVGNSHQPEKVNFNFKIPEKDYEKFNSFFNCPVLFNQDFNAIEYKTTTLDKKLIHRDSKLLKHIERMATKVLQRLTKDHCLSERVSEIMKAQIYSTNQVISLSGIAKQLNVSGRTLQRKLKQESENYSKILESVRKEEAIALLGQRKLNINEIAWFLGYSEASTFISQFKNWTSKSPSSFRKK